MRERERDGERVRERDGRGGEGRGERGRGERGRGGEGRGERRRDVINISALCQWLCYLRY